MQGAGELEIEVKGSAALLRTLLSNMDNVERYSVSEENGTVRAAVVEKAGTDVREQLFYELAENHMPLLVLQKKTGSLEDIFLELTDKGQEVIK